MFQAVLTAKNPAISKTNRAFYVLETDTTNTHKHIREFHFVIRAKKENPEDTLILNEHWESTCFQGEVYKFFGFFFCCKNYLEELETHHTYFDSNLKI